MFTTFRYEGVVKDMIVVEKSSRPPPSTYGTQQPACVNCHRKKLKCTSEKTGCARCRDAGLECQYSESTRPRRQQQLEQGATKATKTKLDKIHHQEVRSSRQGSIAMSERRSSNATIYGSQTQSFDAHMPTISSPNLEIGDSSYGDLGEDAVMQCNPSGMSHIHTIAPSRGEQTDLQSPPYGPFDLDFGLSTTYDIGLDDSDIDLTAFLETTPATITPPEESDTRPAFILEPHSNSMTPCTSTAVAGSAPKKDNILPCDCMQKVFPFLERVQKLAEESDSGSQDATASPRPNLMNARELTRLIRSLKDSVLQLRRFFQCTQCSSSASFMTVLILLAGDIVTTLWAAAKSCSPQSYYSPPLTPGAPASSMTRITTTNCVEDMRTKRLAAFPVRNLPDSGEYRLDTEEEHYAIISTLAKVQLRTLLIILTEMKARESNADWNQQLRSVRSLEERVRTVALGWTDGAQIRGL